MFDDSGNVLHADPNAAGYVFAGIAAGAASAGATVTIVEFAQFSFSGWAWVPGGPLFVTAHGILTQTCPTSGIAHLVARAVTPTEIFIDTGFLISL